MASVGIELEICQYLNNAKLWQQEMFIRLNIDTSVIDKCEETSK